MFTGIAPKIPEIQGFVPAMGHKVLIIEDDKDIAKLVAMHLADLDCTCEIANDGEIGLEKALKNKYDLIILDLMLPGVDGLEITKEVRTEKNYTPIMMLTSRSEEFDKVLGLELGADDYLTKPFSIRELVARVKAIFRRVDAVKVEVKGAERIQFRDLHIDLQNRTVTVRGTGVELTAKEFDLLVHFAKNPGRAYSRQSLLDSVWGYRFEGYDHTVNSHINRLRGKIEENSAEPRYILTVWGVGYKFADED